MIKSYKTELKPNDKQKTILSKHCGTAIFVFNWGLGERIRFYKEEGKSVSGNFLHKELVKKKKTDFPWMYDVSKCAAKNPLRNLDVAFKNFFRRMKDPKCKEKGFPKFKSKKNDTDSCTMEGSIFIDKKSIKLPRMGWIKLKEEDYLPIDKKVKSATISKRAERWFVSVNVEEEEPEKQELTDEVIGIDLGIKTLATCSNGEIFENQKALRSRTKRLRMFSKSHSRKKKGSKNKEKSRKKLAKMHFRIANIRKDVLHKITASVVKTKPQLVVMEDLNIKGMSANRRLSRSIMDCGFFEFRRQLEYKLKWIGSYLMLADRWFPSSKMCSNCFHIKEDLKLSDRIYFCEECFLDEERDFHSSVNLMNYPQLLEIFQDLKCKSWKEFSDTVGSTGKSRVARFQACGDYVRLPQAAAIVCEAGIKQKTFTSFCKF